MHHHRLLEDVLHQFILSWVKDTRLSLAQASGGGGGHSRGGNGVEVEKMQFEK